MGVVKLVTQHVKDSLLCTCMRLPIEAEDGCAEEAIWFILLSTAFALKIFGQHKSFRTVG